MNWKWSFTAAVFAIIFLACNTASKETGSSAKSEKSGYQNVSPAEFRDLMKKPNTMVIDVRTFQETSQGKIDGALDIDIRQDGFEDKIKLLPKDKTYLVYCRSGRRSAAACEIMEKNGFTKLYNMEGGWLQYSKLK